VADVPDLRRDALDPREDRKHEPSPARGTTMIEVAMADGEAVERGEPPTAAVELLRALHEEHGADLLRYALRHTGNRQLAEDVVQETFTRAWRHPGRVAGDRGSARSWLFTVARNLIVDDLRSARHNREQTLETVPEASTSDDVDGILDRILLADALASLSPEHRVVIVDSYYLGRPVREVAERLGIPEGTVKSRLHYGLRALRVALEERGIAR
jgi:RNA polymerase sigma-70 factor (ECF subfamily)